MTERDNQMKEFGWDINSRGEWSMDANRWIAKNERRIIKKYHLSSMDDYVTAFPEIDLSLDRALRDCIQLDRTIRDGKYGK